MFLQNARNGFLQLFYHTTELDSGERDFLSGGKEKEKKKERRKEEEKERGKEEKEEKKFNNTIVISRASIKAKIGD